jgi:hypothetical protein
LRSPKRQNSALGWKAGLLALSLALSSVGCLSGRSSNPFDESTRRETVILRAENRNLHDAILYLGRGTRRTELGTVSARGFQYFEFSWPFGVPLDLEIELAVGDRYRLPAFPLRGGRLELTINATLRRSTLRQRNL